MIPYTLVLKPGLVIYSIYNGYWFWGRPSFEDLRRDLREVTRQIRPDWDLAAPGLRENWEAGRRLDAPPVPASRPHADRNTTVRSERLKFFFTERTVVSLSQRQEEPVMEYLVTMTTHVPDGTPEQAVDDVRAREAARSRELAAAGHLLRLWRPPLRPGEWRSLGLFAAADGGQLEEVLTSMPLRVWRTDEVTPLAPHPNDPALAARNAGTEFLTTFTLSVPEGTPGQAVDDTEAREARRAKELAGQGHLLRLWRLPGPSRALGLWNAGNPAEMQAILKSLPLDPWMTVETTPLSRHPSDPGDDHPMTRNDRRVAIITGGSQGIGAGLMAGYRGRGWAVVANALTIKPSEDPDVLTVEGDIAKPATADRIIEGALERFGRIDTLVNNAGGSFPSRSLTTPPRTTPWSSG